MDKTSLLDSVLFNGNPNPMLIIDRLTYQILNVNEAAIEKYGYSPDEFLAMNISKLRYKDDKPEMSGLLEDDESAIAKPGTWRHVNKKGQILYVQIAANKITYRNRPAFLESINDVTYIEESKRDLQHQFKNHQLALIEWDNQFHIIGWSDEAEKLLGWKAEEVIGKTPEDFKFVHEDSAEQWRNFKQSIFDISLKEFIFEIDLYTRNGQSITTEWMNTSCHDIEGNTISVLTRISDITEKRESEYSIRLLTNAVKAAQNGIVITDFNGKIEWVNPAFTKLTGYSSEDAIGHKPSILKSGEQDEHYYAELWNTIKKGKVWHGHLINRRKDGSTYHEEQTVTPLRDANGKVSHFIAIKQDITSRIESEELIRKSLKEKEILLSEIHHRVKNNLAIVSSLLEIQLFDSDNEQLTDVLYDSMMRIKSIAIIHEQLYNYSELSAIEFKNYIEKLVETIEDTFQFDNANVEVVVRGDNVVMDINIAIPCGLIINKLVTNAFKHAFKNRKKGTIDIQIDHSDDQYQIEISDNGVGLPEDFKMANSKSMGMVIVQTLAEQLKSDFKVHSNGGTMFSFTFPEQTKSDSLLKSFGK